MKLFATIALVLALAACASGNRYPQDHTQSYNDKGANGGGAGGGGGE